MDTAIIVLNRNQPEMTDRLCDHIVRYTKANYKLYVIEAGSDEDKLPAHHTHWINDPWTMKNGLRPAKGFNKGIEIARQDGQWDAYWCVMNDMNFYEEDTLSLMLADLEKYSEIGLVQPSHMYSMWGDRKIDGTKFRASPGRVKLVPYVSHFAFLVKDELLNKIGPLYDESNFLSHGGDIEICWRTWQAGLAVAISGNCKLWEFVGGSSGGGQAPEHRQFISEAQEQMLAWMARKYGFRTKYDMTRQCGKVMARWVKKNSDYAEKCDVDYIGVDPSLVKPLMARAGRWLKLNR